MGVLAKLLAHVPQPAAAGVSAGLMIPVLASSVFQRIEGYDGSQQNDKSGIKDIHDSLVSTQSVVAAYHACENTITKSSLSNGSCATEWIAVIDRHIEWLEDDVREREKRLRDGLNAEDGENGPRYC